ncbi:MULTISPECIES: hypothetical protein [unclassified Pseudoalteromonas]|uniref:hypothetical protein n=1 Tax=unclassified Pseudoalteromonas TaxID=194690 RepID=UPI003014CB95
MDVLKSIGDLLFSTLEAAKERAKSPLVGTFVLAWLIFNWQLVYFLLFADLDTTHKIRHIDIKYADIWFNLIYPLLTTTGYIVFYPLISNLANIAWISMDKLGRFISNYILEKRVPLSREESARLYQQMRAREESYRKELADKQALIDSLYAGLSEQGVSVEHKESDVEFKPTSGMQERLNETDSLLLDNPDEVLKNTDSSFYIKDLIASKMELDKNDPIHSRELSGYYEIISQLLKCYPEPWSAKELVLKDENMKLNEAHAVAYAKKLAKKNWIKPSPQRGYKAVTMTGELASEINSIHYSVSK